MKPDTTVASWQKNIFANYLGQVYAGLIGVVIYPLYLRYMGAESYGLIGFYLLLQAWLAILDFGLSPALGREVARLKGHPGEQVRLRTVVNTLEYMFGVVAMLVVVSLYCLRDWVAGQWLHFAHLPHASVSLSLAVIAVILGLRFYASILRSAISAYEAQVWLNMATIVINTLRYPISLLYVIFIARDIVSFFVFQAVITSLEAVLLRAKLATLLPAQQQAEWFSLSELKQMGPFALGIAYTGAIWIVLTQLDKLLFSTLLDLSQFGYLALVASISAGLGMLASPVSNAILPRMTNLLAQQQPGEMIRIYRIATRLIVCMVSPVAIAIMAFPEMTLYAWTGDAHAAAWGKPVLPWFVLGNAVLALVAFQYYLQYAHGVLKYHVLYNTVSLIINVPLVVYMAFHVGVIGVAWVWAGFRMVTLLAWVPFIHRKFCPGLHATWLLRDVLPPLLVTVLVLAGIHAWQPVGPDAGRWLQGAFVMVSAGLAMLAAFGVSMRGAIGDVLSRAKSPA